MPDYLNQLRSFVEGVLNRDGHDLESAPRAVRPRPTAVAEALGTPPPDSESGTLEAIISLHRPVFPVVNDKVDPASALNQMDAEETAMTKLVSDYATTLNSILPSVGRIDLPEDENYPWAGTGWIIDSELSNDIVITNAHVAQLFAERSGATFTFTTLP